MSATVPSASFIAVPKESGRWGMQLVASVSSLTASELCSQLPGLPARFVNVVWAHPGTNGENSENIDTRDQYTGSSGKRCLCFAVIPVKLGSFVAFDTQDRVCCGENSPGRVRGGSPSCLLIWPGGLTRPTAEPQTVCSLREQRSWSGWHPDDID